MRRVSLALAAAVACFCTAVPTALARNDCQEDVCLIVLTPPPNLTVRVPKNKVVDYRLVLPEAPKEKVVVRVFLVRVSNTGTHEVVRFEVVSLRQERRRTHFDLTAHIAEHRRKDGRYLLAVSLDVVDGMVDDLSGFLEGLPNESKSYIFPIKWQI